MSSRIPQSFIDDLLARTDIVSVIEAYVPLKKAGANYHALCPFHQEKTPSFTVSPSKQFYHCFGCGVSGNAISFLMEYERMSFVEAIEALAQQAGMIVPQTSPESTEQSENFKKLYDIMQKTARFFYTQLGLAPQAIQYLKQRGLTKEIIKKFGIGYAPTGWDNLLKTLGFTPETRQQLLTTGMLIQKNDDAYYDRFRNRIMFPIRDQRGRFIGFGGRVMQKEEQPKYLNSPETPIFHKGTELYGLYEVKKSHRKIDRLLVVEGYMDVIGLAQHGIDYAVATLGTAITTQHVQRLFRTCTEIVFCFDGDTAGQSAAWRALEIVLPLLKDNWAPKFIFLSQTEDPDSLVQKIGKDAFEKLILQAPTLTDFFFNHLKQDINLNQIDGRAKFANIASEYIQKIPGNFIRDIMLDTLAQLTKLDQTKLEGHLDLPASQQYAPTFKKKNKNTKQTSPMSTAITLLIQYPHFIEVVTEAPPQIDMPGLDLLNAVIEQLQKARDAHIETEPKPFITTGALLEYWRDKPESRILNKLASHEHLLSETELLTEFTDAMQKIRRQAIDFTIKELTEKTHRGESSLAEKKLLQKLQKEQQKK